jgi:hypothetical protein
MMFILAMHNGPRGSPMSLAKMDFVSPLAG